MVIVGGGYIGLEAAAVLRELGKAVTLVEAQDRVLARVAAEPISRFYEAEHRAKGVEILSGDRGRGDRGKRGRRLHRPPVRRAGALPPIWCLPVSASSRRSARWPPPAPRRGAARSSTVFAAPRLPDVFCIGDGAVLRDGPGIRIESVQNANDQATAVAKALCGSPVPYAATPWFWSNQYDLKLQTVGLGLGHDATVLRGDPASRSFSLIYLRGGVVIAADCINATKDYVQARKLIEAGCRVPPEMLEDQGVPLKSALEPV